MPRREIPELVKSDNAKTFEAAATQLRRILTDLAVMSFLLKIKIQWKFNLEKAPWWGVGGGGRFNRCLKKTLGKARLTYEDLLVVLTEVE